ncbi:MAG: hypothetical protein U0136_04610 [Bdellovibrionota bacterium]
MKPRTGMSFALALLLLPQAAHAADHLLSTGHNELDTTITVNATDTFHVDLTANHSYACDAIPFDAASDFDWSTTVQGTASGSPESIVARTAGSITPVITGESNGVADNRIVFTPTTSDRFVLTVQSAKSGGEDVRIRCLDTTLYGGFNTNVNDFNFLELTNVSNAQITAKVTAINYDGTVAINGQSVVIDPTRRLDVDIHTPAGANKYGMIIVTHNGPAGALKGNVSQYSGNVNNFDLAGSEPLRPIEQNP